MGAIAPLLPFIIPAVAQVASSTLQGGGPLTSLKSGVLAGGTAFGLDKLGSVLSPSANSAGGIGQSIRPQPQGLSIANPQGINPLQSAGVSLGSLGSPIPDFSVIEELLKKNPLLNIGGGLNF